MQRHSILSLALSALALAAPLSAAGEPFAPIIPAPWAKVSQAAANDAIVDHICTLISAEAEKNDIPKEFFARLIWKESRFDKNAVSPAGAEGIAQFMPGTAKIVGLADPFDVDQAIPASAKFLAYLKGNLGNYGLAAAAYNAGEGSVSRWLNGGFLPLETEDYVLDITGEPADNFVGRRSVMVPKPLKAKLSFGEGCRKLPVIEFNTVPMSRIARKPWGVQVAGNFRRSAAVNQYERARRQFASVLADHKPVVSKARTPMGRRSIYAVRIGADSRGEANKICALLHSAGGACIVLKNR